ncbi:hemerythrin domain-containing protein [Nocardia bovistercoris]|uniref:Hemerythrin domain-containing protein n=1 Tax=Nocardia bovistercoris TaxID=2785916 RepID=A0A931IK74_9NOCA|nr:hemerythrin domain-containing protein [Nocardia bovistercoris]MBH0781150.1 hemerythrin domain-containing protein [Nocardia bovistercoris]
MTGTSATDTRVRPDVTGMRIAHRGMLADTRRFAEITARIAAGESCPPARAAAVAQYLTLLCDSVHHHHTIEDTVVWPVLVAAAGPAVAVDELEDDHVQLDAVLGTLRQRASAFGAADADRARAAAALTETLDAAHALLSEHIAEEERVVFPIVDRYVRVDDWERVEKAAKKGSKMSFEVPRFVRYATEEELVELRAGAGPLIRILLGLLVRSFDKREAVIAG